MHNAIGRVFDEIMKEAGFHTTTNGNGSLFTQNLTQEQVHTLHAENRSSSTAIIPDRVVELGEDKEDVLGAENCEDTRAIVDFKTIGHTNEYQNSSKRTHRSFRPVPRSRSRHVCCGVGDRGARVNGQYLTKAVNLDRKLVAANQFPANHRPGPVESRMKSFGRVLGLAVGPFCEISNDWRKILKPAIIRIAKKRRGGMVLNNLTLTHTAAAVYDSIRKRLGWVAHTRWHQIMLQSLNLVQRAAEDEEPDALEFDGVDAEAEEGQTREATELGA